MRFPAFMRSLWRTRQPRQAAPESDAPASAPMDVDIWRWAIRNGWPNLPAGEPIPSEARLAYAKAHPNP